MTSETDASLATPLMTETGGMQVNDEAPVAPGRTGLLGLLEASGLDFAVTDRSEGGERCGCILFERRLDGIQLDAHRPS